MVEDFHGGGGMEESHHLEEEEPKICDHWSHNLKHLCQDKMHRKLDTQVDFLYSKCIVNYKRGCDVSFFTSNFPMKGLKTWCISRMKVLGALVKPNGMTNHSYKPILILKGVFHSSPNLIRIWL